MRHQVFVDCARGQLGGTRNRLDHRLTTSRVLPAAPSPAAVPATGMLSSLPLRSLTTPRSSPGGMPPRAIRHILTGRMAMSSDDNPGDGLDDRRNAVAASCAVGGRNAAARCISLCRINILICPPAGCGLARPGCAASACPTGSWYTTWRACCPARTAGLPWTRRCAQARCATSCTGLCSGQALGRDAAFVAITAAGLAGLSDREYRAARLAAGLSEGRLHLAACTLGASACGMALIDSEMPAVPGEPWMPSCSPASACRGTGPRRPARLARRRQPGGDHRGHVTAGSPGSRLLRPTARGERAVVCCRPRPAAAFGRPARAPRICSCPAGRRSGWS